MSKHHWRAYVEGAPKQTTIVVTVVASLLMGVVPHAAPGEELEYDLDATVESVYVPPGSAYNFLGLLFSELQINGGIELGNLYGEVLKRKRNPDTETARRVSSPGVRRSMLAIRKSKSI